MFKSHKKQLKEILENQRIFTMQFLVDNKPWLIHSCVKRIFDLRQEFAEKGYYIEYFNGDGNWYKSGYMLKKLTFAQLPLDGI
jgi:hypothetical protein